MTLDDLARALLAGIDAGGWHVVPPRDPANLPTMEEYTASRLTACRFAVAAVVLALAEPIAASWETALDDDIHSQDLCDVPTESADAAMTELRNLIAEARALAGTVDDGAVFAADHPDDDEAIRVIRIRDNSTICVFVKTDMGHNDGPWSQMLLGPDEVVRLAAALIPPTLADDIDAVLTGYGSAARPNRDATARLAAFAAGLRGEGVSDGR